MSEILTGLNKKKYVGYISLFIYFNHKNYVLKNKSRQNNTEQIANIKNFSLLLLAQCKGWIFICIYSFEFICALKSSVRSRILKK